jgi:hypothetical protein
MFLAWPTIFSFCVLPDGPKYRDCRWLRSILRVAMAMVFILGYSQVSYGQSTFGTVLGAVKDPSGGAVPGAKVNLINTGTNAFRSTLTNSDGSYQFVNTEIGNYKLTVEAPGFQVTEYAPFNLEARATVRLDVGLKVASQVTTVNVEAVSVVQTDISNVSEAKGSLELTDLPVAIGTRSSGSTSAYSTLTAQPGVQTDSNNNIMVAGAGPSQLSVSIDGISSVGPGTMGALSEMFPSFNSIEEIKISETLNPAEYGGVADITTVSKSGTNEFHGGAFENVQNTAFNAADTFSHAVAEDKLNNFGMYLGGPVIFPKLYHGRNRTFFFGSFEVLRLPKSLTAVLSVPTQAMRNGDLSAYLSPSLGGSANQLTGYPGNVIPANQLNPYTQKLLNFIYPLPNFGPSDAISNNYLARYAVPINSAQGDVRLDQNLGPNHRIFMRYSYKNRRITTTQIDLNSNPSSPLLGGVSKPEIYNSLAASYNWVISPNLVNELRGGASLIHRNVTFGVTAQQAASTLGLTTGPGALPSPSALSGENFPQLSVTGFGSIYNQRTNLNPHEGTYQLVDNLTWTRARHTFKFGLDYRYLTSDNTNEFSAELMGGYTFNGSALSALLGSGAATPMASILLGYPDATSIASILNPDAHGHTNAYGVYAQDDYKVSQSLTLNYGLRWEYHLGFQDQHGNLANFDPFYTSTFNGQTVKGAVVVSNQSGLQYVNPSFAESIAPIPIITAAQAGIPQSLHDSSKRDFAPRVGFAWRVGGSNKTVLRGGYGRFIESSLSAGQIFGWGLQSTYFGFFVNSLGSNGLPIYSTPYSFPSKLAVSGSQGFYEASTINYKDPIVEEWNLTLERDLGKGVGLRVSYDGNHSYNVPTFYSLNQVQPNTLGYSAAATQAQIPFPEFAYIGEGSNSRGYGNYQAGTISVKKRAANLQFELSYTYTRDLTNIGGVTGYSAAPFASEIGQPLSDPNHSSLDYGNTPFARRHRVLATFLYELPFGKGRTFLNTNSLLDRVVGGWELGGLALFQSGPFMSVTTLNDPSGTGFNLFNSNGGRADTVPGADPYAGQSIQQWINPNAFAAPDNNIGRFGNSSSGTVVGPGTQAVALSLLKRFSLTERIRAQIGMQVSNAFNHPNYAPPSSLTVGVAGFGQLTQMQSAEGTGPRQVQLTGRLTF